MSASTKAVMQQALEALEGAGKVNETWADVDQRDAAIASLRAALAEGEAANYPKTYEFSVQGVSLEWHLRREVDAYLASLPSPAALRAAVIEECAAILDSVDNFANPMTANDCAAAIRALKTKDGHGG